MDKTEQDRIKRQLNYYLAKTSIHLRASSIVKMAYGLSIKSLSIGLNLIKMKTSYASKPILKTIGKN